jgi:adenine-specific DNA-methyltransferase
MRLELTWPNKDKFLLVPKDETGKPVWVERDHPAASEVRLTDFTDSCGEVDEQHPFADNLLFTGDSLDVLRALAEVPEYAREYRGNIKLVYIDPPFNTGQTFTHYDDWMEHSTWLSFMRDRLLLIKDLLATDGSVWVHLDDAEQHRMRCLLDEVFGAQNFVATIVWEKARGAKGDTHISTSQDYIAVYATNKAAWKDTRNLLPRSADQLARYTNPDDDPRGPWRQGADGTAKSGSDAVRFPITLPSGRTVVPPAGNYWRFTQERFEAARSEGRVYFGRSGDSLPVIKTYLSEAKDGVVPHSWWSSDEVGSNQEAKRDHLRKMFPGIVPFATPKPERLMERILHIASNPGDVVLDCFGGSGTTAATAHKMGRRWITSEILPETVEQFTRPRLEMIVNGDEPGGITKALGWTGGGGFRSVRVAPSMYEVTRFGVMLADWAVNGRFSRAVAGQLGFEWEPDGVFCGRQGRMRLSVFDGAVGCEEVRQSIAALAETERVTIVAQAVLPDAEDVLRQFSKGSRIRKAPRDLLSAGAKRARRRLAAAERAVQVQFEGADK